MGLLGFDKLALMFKIIKSNGGIIASSKKAWYMDTLKMGQYVGSDTFGNKYYQNNRYLIGRSRWVEYNPLFAFEYDASLVTPEWHGWLHYKTDRLPCEDSAKIQSKYKWMLPAEENMTGTDAAFYPYTTTRPHILPWDGKSKGKAIRGHKSSKC